MEEQSRDIRWSTPRGGVLGETGAEVGERTRAAWAHREPDLLLRGATVLLPTDEWARRDVGIVGGRIATVAEGLTAPGEATVELAGKTIVPGYVEPHAHTLGPLSVAGYCGKALAHGVCCVVSDDSFAYTFVAPSSYRDLLDISTRVPMVLRWSLRLETPRTIPYPLVAELLDRDDVTQLGELMTRQVLVEPTPELCELIAAARSRGLRIEGHSPGASAPTLLAGAAAGLTADHEARTGDELTERLRAGLWAFIRHTDLLRDTPQIVTAMLASGGSLERTAFTSDWSLPPWIAGHGTVDVVIDAALGSGLPSGEAYACASRRPALYEGLDAHLGAVAPGRLASLNVLTDPAAPSPERVFSLGREVARDGELLVDFPDVDWERLDFVAWTTRPSGPVVDSYRLLPDDPEIFLESASMIRPGRGPGGAAITAIGLHEPSGTLARARAYGFPADLEGIASTLTPRRLLVALGAEPEAVARCVDAVFSAGGGIALQHRGELTQLPLPYGGAISAAPFEDVERFWSSVAASFAALGSDLLDPLSTLLYLGSSGLPGARFAEEGLINTRAGETIQPARPVAWSGRRSLPTNRPSSRVDPTSKAESKREG
jgi:adenine deaminase